MTIRQTHDGDNSVPRSPQTLRERALAIHRQKLAGQAAPWPSLSAAEGENTIHELQVHQIELEMQNEELRRAQLELAESKERFHDLYDRAPVGYCLISSLGLIQEANRTFGEMLGIAPSFLQSERFSKFIHEPTKMLSIFCGVACLPPRNPRAASYGSTAVTIQSHGYNSLSRLRWARLKRPPCAW